MSENEQGMMEETTQDAKERSGMVEYTLRLTAMKRFFPKVNKALAKIQALVDREFGQLSEQGVEDYQQDLLASTQANIAEDIDLSRETVQNMGVLPICTITAFGVYYGSLPFDKIKNMIEKEPEKYYLQGSDGSTPSIKGLERLIAEKSH